MVYLLGSELGSLLCLYSSPFAIIHSNPAVKQSTLPHFAICHPEVNDVISKLSFVDKVYIYQQTSADTNNQFNVFILTGLWHLAGVTLPLWVTVDSWIRFQILYIPFMLLLFYTGMS